MTPLPHVADGIGYCRTSCPAYDGKRCSLTGFQPDNVCEPWLRELIQERDELSAERERISNLLIAEEETNKRLVAERDILTDQVNFLKAVLSSSGG